MIHSIFRNNKADNLAGQENQKKSDTKEMATETNFYNLQTVLLSNGTKSRQKDTKKK